MDRGRDQIGGFYSALVDMLDWWRVKSQNFNPIFLSIKCTKNVCTLTFDKKTRHPGFFFFIIIQILSEIFTIPSPN
jgi:hypothetical protein